MSMNVDIGGLIVYNFEFEYYNSVLENVEFESEETDPSKVTVTVAEIIQKSKRITQKFNQSPLLVGLLRKELAEKEQFESLITAVITRWNSFYSMLDRLKAAWDAVDRVLTKKKNMLICSLVMKS